MTVEVHNVMLASNSVMDHRHQRQGEPTEGKLLPWDERYGDEENVVANVMFQSPEVA